MTYTVPAIKQLMFGSLVTKAESIQLQPVQIKFINVQSLNSVANVVLMPFIEVDQMVYCNDDQTYTLFIVPTDKYARKLALRFSQLSESKEKYIRVEFIEELSEELLKYIKECLKTQNSKAMFECIDKIDLFFENLENYAEIGETVSENKETIKQGLEFHFKPTTIMFRNFEVIAKQLIFDSNSLKVNEIQKCGDRCVLNNDVLIPLKSIKGLLYNTNQSIVSLFITMCEVITINTDLDTNVRTTNSHTFDDISKEYLVIIFSDEFVAVFKSYLTAMSERFNFEINEICVENSNILSENYKIISQLNYERVVLKEKCHEMEKKQIECKICLEKLSKLMEMKHKIYASVCGHLFCKQCLDKTKNDDKFCPICQIQIDKKYFEIRL